MPRVTSSNPTPSKTFFFNIHFEDLFCKFAKEEMYIFRQKKRMKILFKKKYRGFPCRIWGGYPSKICGDIPVNSKQITCKWCIFFKAISTCIPEVRNYGDFRQHVIPMIITCMLRGTPCDTGISYTFCGEKICSVLS